MKSTKYTTKVKRKTQHHQIHEDDSKPHQITSCYGKPHHQWRCYNGNNGCNNYDNLCNQSLIGRSFTRWTSSWQYYIMSRLIERETWEMKVRIVMKFKKMYEKGGSLRSKAKPKLGKCHKLGHWKFKYNSRQSKMTIKFEQ